MATETFSIGAPDARVLLDRVSWETYEALLADYADRSVPHFTYDRGVLEIVMPSGTHEDANRKLAAIVETCCVEWGIEYWNAGSMTFRREDLERGFEPDSAFYIQHELVVRGRTEVDLRRDPPPDVVIEIDVTHPSLDKFPIYAEIGVPEIWRFEHGVVVVFVLDGGNYRPTDESLALLGVSPAMLTALLGRGRTLPQATPDAGGAGMGARYGRWAGAAAPVIARLAVAEAGSRRIIAGGILPHMAQGAMLADVVALIGTIDIVLGSVDR